jgi:hypothetical protein
MNPKYEAAVLSIIITVLGAVAALNHFAWAEAVQVGVLTVTAITTYLLPLVQGRYQGILKVGLEVVGTIFIWLYPLVVQGGQLTGGEVILGLLAIAKVLGTHVGVASRLDYATAA